MPGILFSKREYTQPQLRDDLPAGRQEAKIGIFSVLSTMTISYREKTQTSLTASLGEDVI